MPKLFISYMRVSTTKQGESGLGLEAQREAVRSYVRSVGGTLMEEHIEIESGKANSRPVLHQALARCRQKRAVLLIAKLDRLSRNVAFISRLMESSSEFVAVDMPAANRLLIHVMAAFAEHERELISTRTKAALAAAKARGVVLGRHGRTLADQQITEANRFAENLRNEVEALLDRGCVRLQDIADGLNDAGFRTREGAKWGPASVQRVLRRLHLRTPAMTQAKAA